MTFKATLFTPIVFTLDNPPPDKYYLEFTKSQIIIPEKFKEIRYQNSAIQNGVNYTIKIYDNIDMRFRYEIKIGNSQPIRLWVNKKEEKKLKNIHGLSWYTGLPIKWDLIKAFITFILALIASLLLFLINSHSIQQKYEEQRKTIESLNNRVNILINLRTIDTPPLKQHPVTNKNNKTTN